MSAAQDDIIPKDKGVQKVQTEGITPFLTFIESSEREFFKAKDFVTLYDLIFKMCIQRDPYNWSETMYELYTHSILDYLLTKVAPAFVAARTQYDVAFLKEWKQRWFNQKLIVQGLAKLFMYLDRFYTPNCFPADHTEVLTNQGFLKLRAFEAAFAKGDLLVACYVPKTDVLEYHPAEKVTVVDGTHQLVSFVAEGMRMALHCTSNHTVWMASTSRKSHTLMSGPTQGKEVNIVKWTGEAGRFHKTDANKAASLAHAEDETLLRFQARAEGGVQVGSTVLPFASVLGLTNQDQVDAFLWLYGYWLGDGTMHFTGGNRYIGFNPVKSQDAVALDAVFARLPLRLLPPVGSAFVRVDKNGYVRSVTSRETNFYIYHPAWFEYFAREYHAQYAGGLEWAAEDRPEVVATAPDLLNGQRATEEVAERWCKDSTPVKSAKGKAPSGPTTKCTWCGVHVADTPNSRSQHKRNCAVKEAPVPAERVLPQQKLAVSASSVDVEMTVSNSGATTKLKSAKWFFFWAWKRGVLTRNQLRCMLAGLRFADGSQARQTKKDEEKKAEEGVDEEDVDEKDEAGTNKVFGANIGTSSARFRDEIVIVALHAGYSASVTVHNRPGECTGVNKYGVPIVATKTGWRVHYSESSRVAFPTVNGQTGVKRSEWQGTVWCPTVTEENHLIVVRSAVDGEAPSKPIIVGNTDGILTLKEQGYKNYKEQIFDNFAPVARQAILNAIEKERGNEEQDRQLLKEAVDVFVEMGYNYNSKKLAVYANDLEKHIVEHAGQYYQRQSRTWMDADSCPVYLEKVEKVLQQETARVTAYLNRSTQEPLQKECYTQLLKAHQKELLRKKTGLFHLLSINAVEDLSRLYRLYKGYEADLEPIAEMFEEFVSREGTAIVDAAKAASAAAPKEGAEEEKKQEGGAPAAPAADANHALVRNLIGLHAQYNDIVTLAFDKAQIMQKALKKAFEDFVNRDNRVSKLLAKFVNDVLKKGSKVNVRDIESTLDNVVFLYGYISEKDVFERDYQIFLSNRLLMGLCESEHSEKSMIAKLKTECGYQWTNKLEGMFKDVQLSKDLMVNFKKIFDAQANLDIALEVNVCTTGYWPSSRIVPCIMPKELTQACEKYKRFYLNQHSGHKLEWRYDQGQAEITVDFSSTTRKALVVSTYQMMVMLVFNSFKRVTYKQMLDMTGIPKSEIANHLLSLCHPKVAILLKRPNSRALEDTHQFMVNPAYKNALKKITIPLLRAVDTEENSEEENKCIELQRRHQMDAAIVRIMKTRKTMRHPLLVAEVIQQLSARFKPRPNDIKKRIEALIEQDYMERDANERGTYNYKA